ncbi:CatA-like O-acetyltransferase [Brotaphodocola sp.]|uniref:CatA-like O-acetyltransferase n=1 Tax=Brotaphodocola sp. TaxID=3073577 RepID=UPI003D7EA6CF
MDGYRKIDMTSWSRREHYKYYTEKLKIEYNMTVPVDVKKLLDFCHESNHKFYPTMIYLVTKVLNQIENFRMFKDAEGNLCVWDQIVPNYTIFHKEDQTFSDCWTEYSEDFETFYRAIREDMREGQQKRGIKVKADQPANFYCISCVPWTTFTAFGSRTVNSAEPAYFPIITMGKYEESGEKILMPVNLMIAHAVADGYHVGFFFQRLQEAIDQLEL